MNIDLRSPYNHFPHHRGEKNDGSLIMYCDGSIWEAMETEDESVLLMIEPRSIQEENYHMAMEHYNRFKYIFTHDSQLLSFAPNALPIWYWRDYELKDVPKTKDISMICGTKRMCPLHIERMKIADALEEIGVDILGDYKGERCTIDEAYSEYKFAVVIENYSDDYWFTEKILNAFSHKTVPIYYGARNIDEIFNASGMIQVRHLWDIPAVVRSFQYTGIDRSYEWMLPAIEENYKLVQQYETFEDYFFKKYGYLMEKLSKEVSEGKK